MAREQDGDQVMGEVSPGETPVGLGLPPSPLGRCGGGEKGCRRGKSARYKAHLIMKPGVRKSVKFALAVITSLAALVVCAGCGPYPLQPYQAQPYPPPSARGLQAPAPMQPWSQGTVHLRDVADRIWHLTNDVRRQYGLPPVGQEGALSMVSQTYCDDMLRRRFFSHTNPAGLTAKERLKPFYSGPMYGWGEHIWEGSNLSAADREALARAIMNSWMSSSGHREIILRPDYTHQIGRAA